MSSNTENCLLLETVVGPVLVLSPPKTDSYLHLINGTLYEMDFRAKDSMMMETVQIPVQWPLIHL